MTFSPYKLILIAVLVAVGSAFPVQEPRAISGFKVVQQAASPGYLTPGPVTVATTFARHGVTPPPYISEAASSPSLNAEPIVADPGIYDGIYYCPVQIGLPAQTLMLDFGTTDACLMVFSSELPSSQSSGHTVYHPGYSSTAKLLPGLTWYGESIGGGNVYNETVSFGDNSIAAMPVQAFRNLTTPSNWGPNCSGVVGLNRQMFNDVEPTF
jgi:aspergillopepsin I